ncbi:MAG: TolC family protein [Kiritimatiellaeota bacterium]|nr:TolC family protein [Kiritimatiellota bacterium]
MRTCVGVLAVVLAGSVVWAHDHHHAEAEETLRLSVAEIERMFLTQNLELLAERYSVGIAEAQIAQAKVWDNPELTVSDANAWAPRKYKDDLEHGAVTFSLELSQIIQTAGKRSKLVAMHRVEKEMAIKQFEDLLRCLKFELRKTLQELIHLEARREVLKAQEKVLGDLIEVYERQVERGNLPRSELVRLQAALFEIEGELNEASAEQCEGETALRVLLSLPPPTDVEIVPPEAAAYPVVDACALTDLLATMLAHRPDVNLSERQVEYFTKAVAREKAMRYPDVTVGLSYNRIDGLYPNFFGLSVSVPLPIFDRNKGGIREAEQSRTQSMMLAQHQRRIAENEVSHALGCYRRALAFYGRAMQNPLVKDLDGMLDVYVKNLLNRNISIVEYMDFMEVYKDTRQSVLEARKSLALEFEELQFAVGADITGDMRCEEDGDNDGDN